MPTIRVKVLQTGKTACGIEIPATVVAGLGASRKPAVKATLNGYTYRSSLAMMSGKFMLSVSADVRAHSGVKAGDTVDLQLVLDTEPREVAMPPDFTLALDRDLTAKRAFGQLSYSNQRRLVIAIEAAKAPATRERRIEKTVDSLREGRA